LGGAGSLPPASVAFLPGKLRQRPKLFADETTMPVLDPGRGRTKTGQLWAYAADDRLWGGFDPPGVVHVYAPDRKADRPIAHLTGFKGILQVDGYAGFWQARRAWRRSACILLVAHAAQLLRTCPRPLRLARQKKPTAGGSLASEALQHIAEFYTIEKDIRGRSAGGSAQSSR
jgi:hypothetical protein